MFRQRRLRWVVTEKTVAHPLLLCRNHRPGATAPVILHHRLLAMQPYHSNPSTADLSRVEWRLPMYRMKWPFSWFDMMSNPPAIAQPPPSISSLWRKSELRPLMRSSHRPCAGLSAGLSAHGSKAHTMSMAARFERGRTGASQANVARPSPQPSGGFIFPHRSCVFFPS